MLELPDWPGHRAGQHVDVRLTAEDGYQAQRSYSIASAPGGRAARADGRAARRRRGLAVPHRRAPARRRARAAGPDRRLLRLGELRSAARCCSWPAARASSRSARCCATIAASGSDVPVRLLYSARTLDDVIYRDELATSPSATDVDVRLTLTRALARRLAGLRRRIDRRAARRGRLAAGRAAARLRLRPDRLRRDRGRARSSSSATSRAGSRPSASDRQGRTVSARRSTGTRSPACSWRSSAPR